MLQGSGINKTDYKSYLATAAGNVSALQNKVKDDLAKADRKDPITKTRSQRL